MQLKAVLFDLDGTLMDSVSTILESNQAACAEMGIPYDEALIKSWIGIPLETQAQRLAKGRESEFIDTYRRIYLGDLDKTFKLFPDTLPMLDTLKKNGYLTALVTSKGLVGTTRCVHLAGMAGKFDVIITCDDVENPKPHPEPVIKAMEKLNVMPDESIYVGDSFFDYQSANGAGVKMAAVSWGARSKEDLLTVCPGMVFDSWVEFLDHINQLN
jgi:pyrophosphatase PpaX